MPPAKILLSWENHVDGTTAILTASQSAGDGAVSNLANPVVGRRWRTTDMAAYVDIDFGADKTVDVLALVFPRDSAFPGLGSLSHTLDPDGGTPGAGAAWSSGAVAIGLVAGYGYHVQMPPASVTARYWRFAFNTVGVPVIDVGRAWAGSGFRPEYNISYGYEDRWDDLSRVSASARSGAEFVDSRARQRSYAFGLDAVTDSEKSTVREFARITGISSQVLFVKDPDNPATETLLGRMVQSTPIRHANIGIHQKAFALRESL